MSHAQIIDDVSQYYTGKIKEHGDGARGVDWNSKESQFLRFEQLLKVVDSDHSSFSIADLGCGYGALIDCLDAMARPYEYRGYDVSDMMITKAKELYPNHPNAAFAVSAELTEPADYVVASGIFNVKMEHSLADWEQYVFRTIDHMVLIANKGVAFNMLTAYSDADKMRDHLYYPQPETLFAHAKKHYSRNVALLHDYDLYEFTMLVRK